MLHQLQNWWTFHISASLISGYILSSMTHHSLTTSNFWFLSSTCNNGASYNEWHIWWYIILKLYDNGHNNLIIQGGECISTVDGKPYIFCVSVKHPHQKRDYYLEFRGSQDRSHLYILQLGKAPPPEPQVDNSGSLMKLHAAISFK